MPVGPEFQDPPSEMPEMPYFVSPPGGLKFPFYEQTVTLSGMSQDFEAIANDPNKDDMLTFRWVANYPPLSPASTLIMSGQTVDRAADGSATSKVTITCDMLTQGADHNLVVIVSDNGFLDSGMDPAAHSNIPYNWDTESPSRVVVTMTGWRITGCP